MCHTDLQQDISHTSFSHQIKRVLFRASFSCEFLERVSRASVMGFRQSVLSYNSSLQRVKLVRLGRWVLWVMLCQVLITTDSCHVHREVARTMPILRRYSRAKLNADQVQTMGKVLDTYTESVSTVHRSQSSISNWTFVYRQPTTLLFTVVLSNCQSVMVFVPRIKVKQKVKQSTCIAPCIVW